MDSPILPDDSLSALWCVNTHSNLRRKIPCANHMLMFRKVEYFVSNGEMDTCGDPVCRICLCLKMKMCQNLQRFLPLHFRNIRQTFSVITAIKSLIYSEYWNAVHMFLSKSMTLGSNVWADTRADQSVMMLAGMSKIVLKCMLKSDYRGFETVAFCNTVNLSYTIVHRRSLVVNA